MPATIVRAKKVLLPLAANASCSTTVTTCTKQSGVIKKCPAYATTPTVEAAVTDMDTAVAALSDIDTQLTQAEALVATLRGKRSTQITIVHLKHDAVETAINTASNGDPATCQAWVGETKTRTKPLPVGVSMAPPQSPGVRNVQRHPGMVLASCQEEPSVVGYAFQMGTDQAHPETWPAAIKTRGHTYKVGNLPIGQMVYFRIAIIRRGSIQGQWSPVLQIQVR
jgi:hypothetical protein